MSKNEATNMDELIEQILEESAYAANPYFTALRDGSFEREDFLETQIQFFFAVVFFSRPMAAVAAKIPNAKQRVEVLRNVWEEHGEGEDPETHGTTFLRLLERLDGITEDEIDARALWPEVRLFNTLLTGACVMDEFLVGVGVMGMIERMFADISAWIGETIVDRGWISKDQLVHYSLHQELDVRHSADFFDVLREPWERGSEERYYIEQGLRLGAFAFNRFYEDLYRARTRRRNRVQRVPHLRT